MDSSQEEEPLTESFCKLSLTTVNWLSSGFRLLGVHTAASEDLSSPCDLLGRRLRGRTQLEVDPKLLILVFTQLMKRQHLNPLDVGQCGNKAGESVHIRFIIGQSGHEHEPNPDRDAASLQTCEQTPACCRS